MASMFMPFGFLNLQCFPPLFIPQNVGLQLHSPQYKLFCLSSLFIEFIHCLDCSTPYNI